MTSSLTLVFHLHPSKVRDLFLQVVKIDDGASLAQSGDVVVLSGVSFTKQVAITELVVRSGGAHLQVNTVVSDTAEPVAHGDELPEILGDTLTGDAEDTAEGPPAGDGVDDVATEVVTDVDVEVSTEVAPQENRFVHEVTVMFSEAHPRYLVDTSRRVLHHLTGHFQSRVHPQWWGGKRCLYLDVDDIGALEAAVEAAVDGVDGCKVEIRTKRTDEDRDEE